MCGIAGYTGARRRGVVDTMLDRLAHRGPDGRGVYEQPTVHLGMVRLAILDLPGSQQPMANADETVCVVFNGEIYNYVELRQALEQKGHRFLTRGDTEVIVHGYEEFGPAVVHHLNGMFSIALWDVSRQELFVWRDRFGVKPLFYAPVPGGLCFGSEIKAVLAHPDVSPELDAAALSHYFSLRHVPAPFTVYRGVRSLPPGAMLRWGHDGLCCKPWFDLRRTARSVPTDEDALVELLDETLRDSVRLRLRSDVAYGAFLSGGLDSSLVVAMMSEQAPTAVKTFTLAFGDHPPDKQDAHYARQVAARYGTEHHEFVMRPSDLVHDLPAIVRHLDQPFAGVLSSYWLSRFMREHVTVALSGDGADDLFGSYGHHRLVWPLAARRAAMAAGGVADPADQVPIAGRPESLAQLAALPPWEWRLHYAAFPEAEKARLLSREAGAALREASTSCWLKQFFDRTEGLTDPLNQMLYLDINVLLPNEVLYFNDMLSMAHALEVRTPFLDYRIGELAWAIPGALKIRQGTLKYIVRRVGARYLPDAVLERPKEGFVLPKHIWLRAALRGLVESTLTPERLALHGYCDAPYVLGLVARFLAGEEALTFRVWTLLMFQLWYEANGPG